MKEIAANSFTPIYDEIEDRLRLVINYQDMPNRVDFMITRNFIINLLPSADEFIIKYYGEDDNTPQEVLSSSKLEKGLSKTDNVNLELFKTDEELLLEVNFSFDKNSKNTLLRLSSKNITSKSILEPKMLNQIFKAIKKSIPNFKWGLSNNF